MSHPDLTPIRAAAALIRRVPFTLAFLAMMLGANSLSGTFSGELDPAVLGARGIGVEVLQSGEVLRFLTAIFLSHDLPMLLRQLVFAALVIGAAEWLWGTWRTAVLFFGLDLASTVILLTFVMLTPGLGHLAGVTDVGMSMGGFGLIGVLVASRRNAVPGLVAVLGLVAMKFYAVPDLFADGGHVIALILGFCIGVCKRCVPANARETDAATCRHDRFSVQKDVRQ